MKTLVVLPTPPLRVISMPGWRASTSATPVAPLRSMVWRSMMDTSPTRSDSGCGVRLAVTTVSGSVGLLLFLRVQACCWIICEAAEGRGQRERQAREARCGAQSAAAGKKRETQEIMN
jgi:hypothetical protein